MAGMRVGQRPSSACLPERGRRAYSEASFNPRRSQSRQCPSANSTKAWSPSRRSSAIPPSRRCWRGWRRSSSGSRPIRSARAGCGLSRLAVRQPRAARAGEGALRLRRRRPRQDHDDGLVLRGEPGGAQAPRPFPRAHGRRPRPGSGLPAEDQGRRDPGRGRHPADRERDRRGKLAALLRRIPRHRLSPMR